MKRRIALVFSALIVVVASSCSSSNDGGDNPGTPLELNSGDFGSGASFEHRFFTAGSYPYHCIHHSPMTGTVTVNASATDTVVAVSITSSSAPFPAASVKPGGRVVWTNNTGMVHTVTSH